MPSSRGRAAVRGNAAVALRRPALAADRGYRAEVRRTAGGVPHVKARDYGSLGYGFGYA